MKKQCKAIVLIKDAHDGSAILRLNPELRDKPLEVVVRVTPFNSYILKKYNSNLFDWPLGLDNLLLSHSESRSSEFEILMEIPYEEESYN